MIKLVLWDYTGLGSAWCKQYLQPNVAQIIRTLKPDDADQAEVILRGDWDYVLIFADSDSREVFDEILSTMRAMNVSTDKIIFADDGESWLRNPVAVYSLMNQSRGEQFQRWLHFDDNKQWSRYVACSADNLHYVSTSEDDFVAKHIYVNLENHAATEMKIFHALAKKFYGTNDDGGWFLDLGANIGTTGIYFTKKLAPNLKLFAVEPDAENFKLLRVNVILNDMESKSTLINCGLGENFNKLLFHRCLTNPGGNGFFATENKMPAEKIQLAPLDWLLAENKIAPEDVQYIWIDTEGFEAQVLLGAKNLLTKSGAPIFMECNLLAWKVSGLREQMIDLLKELGYGHFIWVQELWYTREEKIYPIDDLRTFAIPDAPLGQIGDIFLIKNV